jgi:hypothetical protein
MKIEHTLLLLMSFNAIFAVNRHINNKNHNHKRSIISSQAEVVKEDPSCYSYKKYKIPKLFFDFIELAPVLCAEFMFYVINEYAFDERKDILKVEFYSLSPEDVWHMLTCEKNFDCSFIEMINVIYDKNEFILIYKTRMTIEFMIFAFNTKEKTTKYEYAYFHNPELKKVLHNLLDFVNYAEYLLEDKFSVQQIEEFKKFLHKYVSYKSINHMSFLNELKAFKYFLDVFFKEKNNTNVSFAQQFAMVNRFMTVFKK